MMIVHILFIVFYVFVAWYKPRWALFLICTLLPTYQLRFQVLGLPTTYLEVMIVVLFTCWLVSKFKTQNLKLKTIIQNLKLSNWFWLITIWLMVGLIAVFVSPDRWLALGHWRAYFLEPILFLLVLADSARRDTNLRIHSNNTNKQNKHSTIGVNKGNGYSVSDLILTALGISALYISIWAIYQKIVGQGMASLEVWQFPLQLTIRSTGPFPHSNFLGLFLGPLIILFLGQFLFFLKDKKILFSIYYLLVSVLSFLAIIFARSEGAILGMIVGLIFLGIVYQKTRKWTIFILAILIFFIFLSSIICVSSSSDLRQSTLCTNKMSTYVWQKINFQDLSLQLRLNIWQATCQMIRTNPLLGVGLRGYQQLVNQFQQPFFLPNVEGIISNEFHPYPHNLFLTVWLELGILGLIVFLLIIYQFFKTGFKAIQKTRIHSSRQQAVYPPAGGDPPTGGNDTNKFFNFNFLIFILAAMIVVLIHGSVDTPYFKNDLAVLFWLIIGLLIISKNLDFSSKSEKV